MNEILFSLIFSMNCLFPEEIFYCNIISAYHKLDENHVLYVDVTKHGFSVSNVPRIVSLDRKHSSLSIYIVQLTDSTQSIRPCSDVIDAGIPFAKRYYPIQGTVEIRLITYEIYRLRPKVGIMDTILHYQLQARVKDAVFQNQKTSERIEVTDQLVFNEPELSYGSGSFERKEDHQVSFPEIKPLNYDEVSQQLKNYFVREDISTINDRIYIMVVVKKDGSVEPSYSKPASLEAYKDEVEQIIERHLRYPKRERHEMPPIFN